MFAWHLLVSLCLQSQPSFEFDTFLLLPGHTCRAGKEAPRVLQEVLGCYRRSQGAPGDSQGAPGDSQGAPRGSQGALGGPRGSGRFQGAPEGPGEGLPSAIAESNYVS